MCEPILIPTTLPGGSAADIRVKPSNHRVAGMHIRGHLIARFTSVEQSQDISLQSTRDIGWGCNCTEGVLYIVEGQVIWYFKFSDVIVTWTGWFWVSTKTDSSSMTHCKVYIKSLPWFKCLILGTTVAKKVIFVERNFHGFSFVSWCATCLQRKKWLFMNQFFESLYWAYRLCLQACIMHMWVALQEPESTCSGLWEHRSRS